MRKLFGQILLINSAICISYLAVLKTAVAEEVHRGSEAAVAQKTPEEQDMDFVKIPPTPKIDLRLTQAPNLGSSQDGDNPKSKVQNSKLNQAPATVAVKPSEPTSAQPDSVETSNIEQIQHYSNEISDDDPMGQVTNVSQFRDVQPSDWAYEALSRVVQTYGCLQGYPDGTYRGNRALSRYEFAAGLNACLRQVEALIAKQPDAVSRSDFEALQRLVEEFRTELATLGTRVDNLEGRTAFLEQRQFSTTTKLVAEAIFAVADNFGKDPGETVFQERVRLDFQTSFTGKDLLHTRIAASNANQIFGPDGTGEGTQTFNLTGGSLQNGFIIDWLAYYLPVSNQLQAYIAATGGIHSDYVLSTANPYLDDFTGGNGALSHFGEENPIYSIGGGAGGGLSYKFSNALGLSVGYLAGGNTSPAIPAENNGLFNGDYAALAQINLNPGGKFQLGLTYIHSYHTLGGPIFNLGGPGPGQGRFGGGTTGTVFANNPVAVTGVPSSPVLANSYGAEASFQLSPNLVISGWFSYTNANVINFGDADIWNYAVALAFPNLGKKGNLGGIIVGAEPYLGGFDNGTKIPNDIPLHIEGFYKYQLTDNVSITPGVIWLTAPNQSNDNNDVVIGTLRTTFRF